MGEIVVDQQQPKLSQHQLNFQLLLLLRYRAKPTHLIEDALKVLEIQMLGLLNMLLEKLIQLMLQLLDKNNV